MPEYGARLEVTGVTKVMEERRHQIGKGYTLTHDQEHGESLLRAAACYLDWAATEAEGASMDEPHPFWPWDEKDWNPGTPEEAIIKGTAMAVAYWDAFYGRVIVDG